MARKKYNYKELIEENSYTRKFSLEFYKEWDNCEKILEFFEKNYQSYVYCLHDKDIWTYSDYEQKKEYMDSHNLKVGDSKKPHYHAIITFNNPRYKSTIINELSGTKDNWQYPNELIVKICDYEKMQRYETHEDEDDKFHYSFLDVRGKGQALQDYFKFLSKSRDEESRAGEVMELILSNKYPLLPQLVSAVCKRGLYSHFIRGYSMYKTMIEERNLGMYYDLDIDKL